MYVCVCECVDSGNGCLFLCVLNAFFEKYAVRPLIDFCHGTHGTRSTQIDHIAKLQSMASVWLWDELNVVRSSRNSSELFSSPMRQNHRKENALL